ncbi:MAG: thioredoxin [Bacilli bacterium]|nr:thioredoxin [Bacilli bacterium]MBQ6282714.1 thioredoxin [Bacilli bacterium]
MVVQIKESEFNEKIKGGKVLVDCFATWCGPCRMLSPVLDDISNEVTNYKFYKLDVDEAENVSMEYGIMSIPTLLIFEEGKLKNKIVGLKSKNELIELLK